MVAKGWNQLVKLTVNLFPCDIYTLSPAVSGIVYAAGPGESAPALLIICSAFSRVMVPLKASLIFRRLFGAHSCSIRSIIET